MSVITFVDNLSDRWKATLVVIAGLLLWWGAGFVNQWLDLDKEYAPPTPTGSYEAPTSCTPSPWGCEPN